MSAPPPPTTPKGPKSSRRNPKRLTTPNSNSNARPNNMTPLTSKSNPSLLSHQMNEANDTAESGGNKKKKGRPVKKNNNNNNNNNNHKDDSKPSVTANGDNQRHTSSHSSIQSPPAVRDSPHYAGPTFHASPAPSALPIPSFFSKSVPDVDHTKPDDSNDDSPDSETGTSTPTKAKGMPQQSQPKEGTPTASPLDFLFKAARDARNGNPAKDSEDRSFFDLSPPPPDALSVRQGETTPGGVFPLELESPDPAKKLSIGPSFATPYKDRMNAFRSASSPSHSVNGSRDQEQKKVKAEALKNLLLNPTPQRPVSSNVRDRPNLHTSSSTSTLETNYGASPFARHASHPSTSVPYQNGPWNAAPSRDPKVNGGSPHRYAPNFHHQETYSHHKPSHLRTEVSSNTPVTPPRRPAEHYPEPYGASSVPAGLRGSFREFSSPTPNRKVSYTGSGVAHSTVDPLETKRMEDDLRRMLNLGVRGPNGLGQSIA